MERGAGKYWVFISIHALREEGDDREDYAKVVDIIFLSTPSARRATAYIVISVPNTKFLSTPSARRATFWRCRQNVGRPISIHALREEGDAVGCSADLFPAGFLSTPSARRATQLSVQIQHKLGISIHALREEGDSRRIRLPA